MVVVVVHNISINSLFFGALRVVGGGGGGAVRLGVR
jgi:hypothetical protein